MSKHPSGKSLKGMLRGPRRNLGPPPSPAALRRWFERSDLPLSETQYQLIWTYHTLIRKHNAACDLTRIYQFDAMVLKHYIDSVLVAKLLDWKLPSPLLDIGTGAGLPGIPLKIVCPEVHVILAEGRRRRIRFLLEAVNALNLQGIEVLPKRILPGFDRPVAGVITRALETIPKTLHRVRNCLTDEGWAIFMKGPNCDAERDEAVRAHAATFHLRLDKAYLLPNSSHRRRLLVFERLRGKGPVSSQWE